MSEPLIRRTPQLGIHDAETLAGWFLYRMPPEQRHELIADLPLVYARVFPGVGQEVILAAVRDRLLLIRRQQREGFAAAASDVAAQLEEEP